MRQLTAAVAVAAVSMLVASCGDSNDKGSGSSTTATNTSTASTKSPVAQAALANSFLTPAEIDTLLGVTGTKSKERIDKLQDDSPKPQPDGWKFPEECISAVGSVEAPVYNGSGYTAVIGDDDVTSLNNDQDIELAQALVLFPSAKEANDFLATSTQRWSACGDRQVVAPAYQDNPEITWKFGPFANANGILSTTASSSVPGRNGGPGMTITIGRALTVRNNVAIDVVLMRKEDQATLAAKAAGQIGDKVDKQ